MATAIARDLEPWRALVRTDYDEVPGMRLTLAQAQRLWGLSSETCREVLDSLVEARFLACVRQQYCRTDCLDGVCSID
jgi:hypothetical protein